MPRIRDSPYETMLPGIGLAALGLPGPFATHPSLLALGIIYMGVGAAVHRKLDELGPESELCFMRNFLLLAAIYGLGMVALPVLGLRYSGRLTVVSETAILLSLAAGVKQVAALYYSRPFQTATWEAFREKTAAWLSFD